MVSSGALVLLGVVALAIAGTAMIVIALSRSAGTCRKCGNQNSSESRYCARCGAPLAGAPPRQE